MKKDDLIKYLKTLSNMQLTEKVLNIISKSLSDREEYVMEEEHGQIKVHTPITSGSRGTYFEMYYSLNEETKEKVLVMTEKEYDPSNRARGSFRGYGQDERLELLTRSKSIVFDENDLIVYRSSFIDDNESFGSFNSGALDYSENSLKEYFEETTPIYNQGRIMYSAKTASQPFIDEWERYGKTNVVRDHGRTPIHGEYSDILVTFDDPTQSDLKLLKESYGQFYLEGKTITMDNEQEIIEAIDSMYKEFDSVAGFDRDGFKSKFDKTMFHSKSL